MAAGAEKFLAEFHGVRHKKQEGVLFLTSLRLAWDSGNGVQVNHPYTQVKAQRVSAETSSKVQLQLILLSETQVNFHFTGDRETALKQRNKCKELLQRLLQQTPQDPDLQAKSSLLNTTPGLHQLYRELVVGGLITAEEFWENRLTSLSAAKGSSSQETGLPSAFLAELEAVSDGSDGCNAMKLSVTHQVIEAIFRTYPSVKLKHSQLVPDKMKEEEFWVQFFQSQRFHRDSGAKSLLSSCLAEEEKGQKAALDTTGGDILNASDSPEEGYSVFPHQPPSPPSSSSSSSTVNKSSTIPHSLVQRCNLHSNMVLQAIGTTSTSSPANVGQYMESESTEAQEMRLKLAPLTETSVTDIVANTGRVAAELVQWTPQQAVNHPALYSAVSHLVPGGSLMVLAERGVGGRGGVATSQLSTDSKDQLFHHQKAVAELLRHFWACFPILNPQLEEKAQRMSECLHNYSEKMTASTTDSSLSDSQVIGHLQTCIHTALTKYQIWQNRRTKT